MEYNLTKSTTIWGPQAKIVHGLGNSANMGQTQKDKPVIFTIE